MTADQPDPALDEALEPAVDDGLASAAHGRRAAVPESGEPRPVPSGEETDAPGPAVDTAVTENTEGTEDAAAPARPSFDSLVRPAAESVMVRLLGAKHLALGSQKRDRWLAWGGVAVLAVIAALLRLPRLGTPGVLVFDETYYVKDAWSLWHLGFEAQWPDAANPAFEAGDVNSFLPKAAYVVHPQVGKWLIGLGMWLGGGATHHAAWRLASALIGIAAVILVARIGRRLFASTVAGLVAGLFMAVDGAAIVHSRTALLDQFLMFFCLVAFGCLLLDRDQARRRLAALMDDGGGTDDGGGRDFGPFGPKLGTRWWRLAAAISLGLACGVKWSGLYFVAVFGLLTVLWDVTARRRAGVRRWFAGGVLRDGLPAFVTLVPTVVVVYVASWWSWWTTPGAYMRQWAVEHPGQGVSWLPSAARSFVAYHQQMWSFHTGLDASHPYAANPVGWIVQLRPTSFFWERVADPGRCGDVDCAQTITSLGNPLLWWFAAVAILAVIFLGVRFADWRALAVLSGTLAGWVPWFQYMHRTVFTFYTIVFTPFVVFTLVYVGVIAVERTPRARRGPVLAACGTVVALILVTSALFYPVWTAIPIPFESWQRLMWLRSWI